MNENTLRHSWEQIFILVYIIPVHKEINGFGQSYTFKFIMKFCQGKEKLIVYFKTAMRFVWVDYKMKNNGFLIILNFAH